MAVPSLLELLSPPGIALLIVVTALYPRPLGRWRVLVMGVLLLIFVGATIVLVMHLPPP
jgi:hypothetical protein